MKDFQSTHPPRLAAATERLEQLRMALNAFEDDFFRGSVPLELVLPRARALRMDVKRSLGAFALALGRHEELDEDSAVPSVSQQRVLHALGQVDPRALAVLGRIIAKIAEISRIAAALEKVPAALDRGGPKKASRIIERVAVDVGRGEHGRGDTPDPSVWALLVCAKYVLEIVARHPACNPELLSAAGKLRRRATHNLLELDCAHRISLPVAASA